MNRTCLSVTDAQTGQVYLHPAHVRRVLLEYGVADVGRILAALMAATYDDQDAARVEEESAA